MRVTIEYAAQVKIAAGVGTEELELDGDGSIASLFVRLAESHGEPLARMLLDADGTPQPSLLVFVGDLQVRDHASEQFTDGDTVTILSPVSGG